jgi:TolB-like protein/DNA-binding winged helix-turn-helix (wHTH) protein/Tfp pilus assembly protein PilF
LAFLLAATLARPDRTLKNCRPNAEIWRPRRRNRFEKGKIWMSAERYLIGDSTLDPSLGRLCRNGFEIPLRPKAFALLEYLVTRAGRLVTKDELLSEIWSGVVVTEDSLTRCVSEARAALGDTNQTMIKTVSRRGYAYVGPVTKLGDGPLAPLSSEASAPEKRNIGAWRRVSALVAAVVIFAICGGVWYVHLGRSQTNALRLSLVVLPFANLNGDPAQDYLGDVVTLDLTTALSRLRGSTVISADSALTLKGKVVDIRQVGRELGVRYALEGSVLRSDGSLRISARLVDTQALTTLWSDRFDVNRVDLLRAQDEIVARLASALQGELMQAEVSRSPSDTASNVDAEDLAMQCEASSYRPTGEVAAPNLELCERALAADPRNVRAIVRLATYYGSRVARVQSSDPEADLGKADALVTRALGIDPDYYAVHCAKATVLTGRHRVRDGIAAAERCLALNPSYVGAYRALASLHFFLASPDKILEYADRGIRLSPRDPETPIFLLFKGWAYFMMGHDDEALVWLRRAAAASPETPIILAALASQLALAGQEAEARVTLARYLALPDTQTRTVAQWDYIPDDNPAFAQFHQRFTSGLRKAGMPER